MPATALALGRAFRGCEFRRAELGGEVAIGSGGETDRVTSSVWVIGADATALDRALDGSRVLDRVELLDSFDDRALFRIGWTPTNEGFLGCLAPLDVAVLEASGTAERFAFALRFHTQEALSAFRSAQRDGEFRIEVRRVAETADWERERPADRMELTAAQHDALYTAFEAGYFAVPRGTNLVALSEELDVSSQSLSERLRRAEGKVLGATLLTEPEAGLDSDFDSQ